ncbi:MAG TPA: PIN domain-containing protein [Candidatus Competibacteraceae bacterium]|nr:PIN domain-containing protein [Candidatus Competibacteraceae bacterium]HSA45536.1 PIN domain-containing protein [Candidatus Competibacteraceae bacterium]
MDIPPGVYRQAAELRARQGLKTPDAWQVAIARQPGCSALGTHDDRLQQTVRHDAVTLCAGVGWTRIFGSSLAPSGPEGGESSGFE